MGKKIRMARIMQGMTQEDLAEAIHRTRSLVSSIERTGKINPHTFQDILRALQLSEEQFKQRFSEERPAYQSRLEKENTRLRKEIAQLKKMISLQEELIAMLKKHT